MLKWISIACFAVTAVAIAGLLAMDSLFSRSPVVIALQVAAVILLVWARVIFGVRSFHYAGDPTSGGLVTSGPYRHIRHPIYTAICVFTWAGVAVHLSLVSVALALLVTAGAVGRMLCEERLVAERYPEYADYARHTKRMIPFLF